MKHGTVQVYRVVDKVRQRLETKSLSLADLLDAI